MKFGNWGIGNWNNKIVISEGTLFLNYFFGILVGMLMVLIVVFGVINA